MPVLHMNRNYPIGQWVGLLRACCNLRLRLVSTLEGRRLPGGGGPYSVSVGGMLVALSREVRNIRAEYDVEVRGFATKWRNP